jgi:membrane associated rhomboid family serine protease
MSEIKAQFSSKEFHPLHIVMISLLMILVMWTVFYIDVKWDLDLYEFGIYPGEIKHLPGVIFAPLLHGSLSHLLNNSIPVFILSAGILFFYPTPAFRIFLLSWLLPGLFAWVTARPSFHIGASGFVYAMAAFVFVSGVIRVNRYLLALSLLVAFLYGSLFFGMFPMEDGISWESHLGGGLSGTLLALLYRHTQPSRYVDTPEVHNDIPEEDDIYIQRIGDAWKIQPDEPEAEKSIHTTNEKAMRVIYHLKPNDKKDEDPA